MIIVSSFTIGPWLGFVAYITIFSTDSLIICTDARAITTDNTIIATGSSLVLPVKKSITKTHEPKLIKFRTDVSQQNEHCTA